MAGVPLAGTSWIPGKAISDEVEPIAGLQERVWERCLSEFRGEAAVTDAI